MHVYVPIEGVHLTAVDRQTNHQCVTGVDIHQIAVTCAPTVLSINFYCYHEHYHAGDKHLRATRSGIGLHATGLLVTHLGQSVD